MAVLVAVLMQLKIILIFSFILIFLDQTMMAQSGNGAACENDVAVTSLGTGQGLNFDEDTLKGKDFSKC